MAQTQEINIPVADPSDPYANPAAMPSSADRAPRSFDIEAFAKPDRKQEDWRYTPIERIEEFFDVFEPSNETQVTVSMIDGSPLAEGVTYAEGTVGDTGTGIVSKPNDRVSAVEWNSGKRAGILTIDGEIDQPVLVKIVKGAEGSSNSTVCDALLVDEFSRSDTYPHVDVREDNVSMAHEATVSKVSEDQLFYLMSRGLSEDEAMGMIVRGFVEPISRELPMEYALELNRLVELQMEGSVG